MACPSIEVRGKRVILLSGYHDRGVRGRTPSVMIKDADVKSAEQLQLSAKRHPDAVAFGYVAGRWIPAA